MPHGFFSTVAGTPVVVIFYDPKDPSVTNKHRKRYRITSGKGIKWSTIIKEYQSAKAEYDMLVKEWHSRYTQPPREIKFPLKKRRKDKISRSIFQNAEPNQNSKPNKHPIVYKGQIFRSKNEIVGCQVLEKFGYEYKTEILITDDDWVELYPDLTFYVPELDKVFVKEIDGAMDNIFYDGHSVSNLMLGFVEGKDLITVRIADRHKVDAEMIENLIRAAIESSIDDIII